MMTPEQISLVQSSFARVAPIAEQAASLFYDRLFVIAPQTRQLFAGDMTAQGRKLMATLAVVVNGLSDLKMVLPAASALARRHITYGVKPSHYAAVGEALLWTLEKGLGDAWTADTAAAWSTAYETLSGFMIQEAYGSAAAG